MIKVFQQAKSVSLREILVGFMLSDSGGDFNCNLLVSNRCFQRRVVSAEQPVDGSRLVLFGAANLCQRLAQFATHARRHVLKSDGFVFDAIHQDNTHARKRVVVQFTDRLAHHVMPCETLPVQCAAFRTE